jgi:hypothetical protein
MTKRENLLRLLHGQKPAWIPCSLNIAQWYTNHANTGRPLPAELADAQSHTDAMRRLGCDHFRRDPAGVLDHLEGAAWLTLTETGAMGPRTTDTLRTPHGTLSRLVEWQPLSTSAYSVEDPVKDWVRDRKAYRWMLERLTFSWDRDVFEQSRRLIGDDGVVMAMLPHTPLKRLHWDFGLDGACLFVMDYPEEAQEVCDLYWSRLWPVLREMAADPRVEVVCFASDNVDTPFYPPGEIVDRYWVRYVREATDLFHAQGKRVFVHACGKLHQLIPAFIAAGLDGLDGMAHPPFGDWTIEDAHAMPRGFVYDGGFSAREQVLMSDDEVKRFYADFFPRLRGLDSFVFAAACGTAITTPWERIKLAVELCRQYGGRPH